MSSPRLEPYFPWRNRFAKVTAAATFGLIFVGGLVTSTGSSLSVPDWPLSFGQFFPPMVGGVRFEHGHRMVAGTVGILMLVLAAWTWREDPRGSVKRLAGSALLAVVLQALLGGITVLYLLPTPVSVSHAGLAQAFFCLVVALTVVTGKPWLSSPSGAVDPGLRSLAVATTAAVYAQIIIGAVMRHTGAGLAIPDFPLAFGRIVPSLDSSAVTVHFAHRVGALLVSVMVLATAARIVGAHREEPRLFRPALLLVGLLALQIALGAFTIWTQKAVLPTTSHVAIGAAILATCLVIALRAHRSLVLGDVRVALPFREPARERVSA